MPTKQGDPQPDDGETYEDFMDRCGDELDENACQAIWDERAARNIVRKTVTTPGNSLQFVMSDETPDLMDDVILSDGWDLEAFNKNPIALFGHMKDFIVGTWTDVHVKNKQLRGTLKLAKKGTSDRINEVISLVEQGILRAVSVGFRPLISRPREEKDAEGYVFVRSKLVETSLVAVPANPNALAVTKNLKISPATLDLVFAGQGTKSGLQRRGLTGGHADRKTNRKGTTMSLAQRIKEMEKGLREKRDTLAAFHETKGNSNYTDEDMETIDKTNAEINHDEKLLAVLGESERNMAKGSDDGGRTVATHAARPVGMVTPAPRPFNVAQKKVDPIELFIRAGTSMILAQRQRQPVEEIRRMIYGEDEATKAVTDWQTKAASAMAMTTVTGWAKELAVQVNVDFMQLLMAASVFGPLSSMGLTLSFGRNAKILIPTRSRTPTIAGSFVGEGLDRKST